MHTQLDISPTGRRIDHRRHLLSSAHAQMMSLRTAPEGKSAGDHQLLANALQLQNALLRKDLTAEMAQELLKSQSPTPPAADFTSLEQRIADKCGIDPGHPYGR